MDEYISKKAVRDFVEAMQDPHLDYPAALGAGFVGGYVMALDQVLQFLDDKPIFEKRPARKREPWPTN